MANPSLIIGDGNWAVKSDSLLGYKVIDSKYYPREFTVTRATTGTRVNAAGLVEVVPYNLVQYSEQFDNASWDKTNVSIAANTTIAPNGTLTADTLSIGVDASSVRHRLHTNSIGSQVVGTIYTGTYYLKANQHQWIQILGNIGYSIGVWANFDLINGVIGNTGGVDTTASIENVGNGWYRCRVSGLATATTTTFFEVITTNNTNSGRYPSYQSLVAQDVCYVWGAQLVEGTDPLTYLPTTTRLNIPRVDYSLGSANLLLEPQRTNLATFSTEFDNANWVKNAGVSVNVNTSNAPSGTLTADTIIGATGTTGWGGINTLNRQITSLSSLTIYTFSVYLKGSGNITLRLRDQSTGIETTLLCNLTTSWQRFEITRTTGAITTALGIVFGNASGNFDAWGAQLEAGAYATSYIPTTAATVTRNADAFARTNFQASGLLTVTKNTFFFNINAIGTTGSNYHFFKFTATSGFDISIWRFVGNQNWNIQLNGVFINTGVSNGKFAVVQDGSQTKFFINGVLNTTTGATGTINSIDSFIGLYQSASPSFIKALAIYPEVLTDAECIALTTP